MASSFVSVFLLFALLAAKCALVVAVPMPYNHPDVTEAPGRDSPSINILNSNCMLCSLFLIILIVDLGVMADRGDSNSSSQNGEDKNKKTHDGSNSHTAGGRTQNCQIGVLFLVGRFLF